jgi:hypothetical protein
LTPYPKLAEKHAEKHAGRDDGQRESRRFEDLAPYQD